MGAAQCLILEHESLESHEIFSSRRFLFSHTDLTDLTDFYSFGVFPLRPNENTRCLQRKRIREIREIRVGNQEGSGQDEQASVQGDDLTMLNVE